MIVVHHLADSRSQRIIWLLEELGLPYEVKRYERLATRQAPPELKAVHPLGKSPVITDGERTLDESGAIIDYVLRRHGQGKLQPPTDSAEYDRMVEWLHYAEGSAFGPISMKLLTNPLGEAARPVWPRIQRDLDLHLGHTEAALSRGDWLLSSGFSAADVQMSFVGELARGLIGLEGYPAILAWLDRFQARPAYRAALARGGPYRFGPKQEA